MNREKFNLNAVLGAFFGSYCWVIEDGSLSDNKGIVTLHGNKFEFEVQYSEDGFIKSFSIERIFPTVASTVASVPVAPVAPVGEKDTEEIEKDKLED